MDQMEERYLKSLVIHLEEISKSLKIISGRVEKPMEQEKKPETYADRYFKRSE